MARRVVMLALALAVLGAAPARADVPPAPAYCWDFDAVGSDALDLFEGTSDDDHVTTFAGDDRVLSFGGSD